MGGTKTGMRYIDLEDVEPGQILGKTIFSSNGQILLAENVELTVYMINTLRRIGVGAIYIKDSNFDDVEIPEVVSEETKRMVIERLHEVYGSLRSGKPLSPKAVSVSVDKLLDELAANKNVLFQLTDIRTADNEMYVHALNVCMMSVLVGIGMELNQSQLKDLAIGALLHDVGKVGMTPAEEKLGGRHHHTWRGYEILKKDFGLLSAHVALQHHETIDGTGLPRALDDEHIHLYAKIVAVANLYDNLVCARDPEERMMPHDACEHLMALAGNKLDHQVTVQFLKHVSIYPTGISVRLSTKETGVVVGQHRGLPGRPIVRVVRKNDDDLEVKEVDLARETTVFIEQVLA